MARIIEMKHLLTALATTAVLSLSLAGVAQATTDIRTGFDLFETAAGSNFFFAGVPNPQFVDFEGLPLGSFNFGGGPVSVDLTDTIVERIQQADLSGGNDTIDVEIVALSLQSVDPVDLGFGAGFETLFITLNTSSPSVQSTMTIVDSGEGSPHGTFSSTLNLAFNVVGSVGGFYTVIEKTIDAQNHGWRHTATSSLTINGVNHLLNGANDQEDFWPLGLVIHDDGAGTAIHRVTTSSPLSPPPGSSAPALSALGVVLAAGLMALGLAYKRGLRS